MPEENCFQKPKVGDRVRAEHRIGGDEMPYSAQDDQTGFRHLVFVDWCGEGIVRIVGFENNSFDISTRALGIGCISFISKEHSNW